ncbi:MAG: TetR/AcrR family transcriptional regulator [Alphaproteobacteria bacterium]|jgi:AcrR family transcriptional regulator|nr:TetR/AcrR family transcriptional regulator [Alphaproteobacteria bacterium]MDP6829593.1 TetR/AcrR family transcriptional regulator [Alphaproteobacteria bacterium]
MNQLQETETTDHIASDGQRAKAVQTRRALLAAAEQCLAEDGFAALSTRRVAERAEVPLSQIHYHFGSKQGLLLALYEHLNLGLLERQRAMFATELPLSQQWDLACDYLDRDIASGFVRVLNELTAAGWSNPEIAEAVRRNMRGWLELLTEVAEREQARLGGLGPFTAPGLAQLVGSLFMGVEAKLLLGVEDAATILQSLRAIGVVIKRMEDNQN